MNATGGASAAALGRPRKSSTPRQLHGA
jgi:hypothetical protein